MLDRPAARNVRSIVRNKTIKLIILGIVLVMIGIIAFFSFAPRRAHSENAPPTITVLILVCSSLSAPNPDTCVIDNSVRHELAGKVDSVIACQMLGMRWAAEHLKASADQYIKVLCGLPMRPEKPKERDT
jgi:hypothetical protein